MGNRASGSYRRRKDPGSGAMLLLFGLALVLFVSAYAYFEGVSHQTEGFPVYSGVCTSYKMVGSGKNDQFRLIVDDRVFVTGMDAHLSRDFFDKVQPGDSLKVHYIPKINLAFRANDLLVGVEKDGKAYFNTADTVQSMRINGWFAIGGGIAAILVGLVVKRSGER